MTPKLTNNPVNMQRISLIHQIKKAYISDLNFIEDLKKRDSNETIQSLLASLTESVEIARKFRDNLTEKELRVHWNYNK